MLSHTRYVPEIKVLEQAYWAVEVIIVVALYELIMSRWREFGRLHDLMDLRYNAGLLRFSVGVILKKLILESLMFFHRLMRIFVTWRSQQACGECL